MLSYAIAPLRRAVPRAPVAILLVLALAAQLPGSLAGSKSFDQAAFTGNGQGASPENAPPAHWERSDSDHWTAPKRWRDQRAVQPTFHKMGARLPLEDFAGGIIRARVFRPDRSFRFSNFGAPHCPLAAIRLTDQHGPRPPPAILAG
jgi:hypothetical protein